MMNTRKDEIEQENKKALPKFRRIIVASLVLGLVLGLVGSFLSFFGAEDFLDRMWAGFSQFVAPVLMILIAVGTLIYETVMIRRNAARLRQWDGEDEAAFDKMDRSISCALSAVNLLMIIGYCLFPIAFCGTLANEHFLSALLIFAAFLLHICVIVIAQQKLVDMTKVLYPEKKGSVYQTNFRKTWMDSCDEAEQQLIGRCAVKGMVALNYTCMVLWVVFTLTALFLNTGFLALITVCLIWGIFQAVYSYWTIKLSRTGVSVYKF